MLYLSISKWNIKSEKDKIEGVKHIKMRDKNKTKEYFDEYIEKQIQNFKEFKELLDDESVLEERMPLLKEMLFEYKLYIITAKYSRGDSMKEMVSDYNEMLEFWKEICNLDYIKEVYEEGLWFISLGILNNFMF